MKEYNDTPFAQPTHEVVEQAVTHYTDQIVKAVKEYDPLLEVEVDLDPCLNSDETYQANSSLITTKHGMVTVFPDFNRTSARAAVVCVGAIAQMVAEGFTEEQIQEDCKVYGQLVPPCTENYSLFGYYLSHKISPVPQS